MPGSTTGIKVEPSDVITSTNTTLDHIEIPGEKKLKTSVDGANAPTVVKVGAQAPIYSVIQTANPISALFEYCKKVKYPDPMFECKTIITSLQIYRWRHFLIFDIFFCRRLRKRIGDLAKE